MAGPRGALILFQAEAVLLVSIKIDVQMESARHVHPMYRRLSSASTRAAFRWVELQPRVVGDQDTKEAEGAEPGISVRERKQMTLLESLVEV